jgi:hypothetical protein
VQDHVERAGGLMEDRRLGRATGSTFRAWRSGSLRLMSTATGDLWNAVVKALRLVELLDWLAPRAERFSRRHPRAWKIIVVTGAPTRFVFRLLGLRSGHPPDRP